MEGRKIKRKFKKKKNTKKINCLSNSKRVNTTKLFK